MLISFLFSLVTIAAGAYSFFEASIVIGYWTGARRAQRERRELGAPGGQHPHPDVTVQLPIYNEGAIACGVIEAVCAFDYPSDKLHIQVLDDSTDETPAILAPLIARMREKGVNIVHLRRSHRQGFKAGALDQGLQQSMSPFVAIFDADFLPPPDFLKRALVDGRAFDDDSVAYVQGRWTHLNEFQNALTRAQAVLLNRHFIVQKPYQQHRNLTVSFNGSAGIWRRVAIDSVGGWSGDTLCEDLDLSFRCALTGWTSVYDESLVCPGEIPPTMSSFKLQQRRWAKGSARCLRKLFSLVAGSSKLTDRAQDLYYIAGYLIHPILLAYALLWPWAVLADVPWPILYAGQACLILGTIAAISGLLTTMNDSGRLSIASARDVGVALLLGVSLMVGNSIAFFVGCFERASIFERTPKQGVAASRKARHAESLHWSVKVEAVVIAYMVWSSMFLVLEGRAFEAVPCIQFALLLSIMLAFQFVERYRRPKTAAAKRPTPSAEHTPALPSEAP